MSFRQDLLLQFSLALGGPILTPNDAADRPVGSLCAVVVDGTPSDSEWKRIESALLPGALCMVVPTIDPVDSICQAEDLGLQVWDVIACVEHERDLIGCAKPSRSERDHGLQGVVEPVAGHEAVHRQEGSAGTKNPRAGAGRTREHVLNHHPTVKPVRLMQRLVQRYLDKPGAVLDPFAGSGTTGVGAVLEGREAVLIDLDPKHADLIEGRVRSTPHPVVVTRLSPS